MEFKVGDVVEWCGIRGKVESIGNFAIVSFRVESIIGYLPQYTFTKDGRQYAWHKEPSLKLIKRLKRKYKVLFIDNNNHYGMTNYHYSSESEFNDKYPFNCKFVKFVDETMIEVEE